MIKYICDKCHEEIKEDIYHVTISCTRDGTYSTHSVWNEWNPKMTNTLMLCEKCKDKVESFVYTGGYFL